MYDIFLADGTYIEIEAEVWWREDEAIIFADVPEDEEFRVTAIFNLQSIAGFCGVKE